MLSSQANYQRELTMRTFFMLMVLLFGLSYQPCSYAETDKIILATDDWEPYISQTQPDHGQFTKIVSAVFKDMGMEAVYIFAPWKRIEVLVKNGSAYAGIPYSYTDKRHKSFDYSVPVMTSSYVFFYNKKAYPNGINYKTLEELAQYRIGGVSGYWYEDLFANAKLKIEYVTTDEQGINKLFANRIDLAACDELVGKALIKKLHPEAMDQIGIAGQAFATQNLHLMISRSYLDAANITKRFNASFKKLYGEKPIDPAL